MRSVSVLITKWLSLCTFKYAIFLYFQTFSICDKDCGKNCKTCRKWDFRKIDFSYLVTTPKVMEKKIWVCETNFNNIIIQTSQKFWKPLTMRVFGLNIKPWVYIFFSFSHTILKPLISKPENVKLLILLVLL